MRQCNHGLTTYTLKPTESLTGTKLRISSYKHAYLIGEWTKFLPKLRTDMTQCSFTLTHNYLACAHIRDIGTRPV